MSDTEIVKEFLVEANESLDKLDQDFVALETHPEDAALLNKIFRTVHTIKGTCGFLEFHKLEKITHVGENLLDSLRAGKIKLTPEITTALLQLIDTTRQIMRQIEATGLEGDGDYSELEATLSALNNQKAKAEPAAVNATEAPLEETTQPTTTGSETALEDFVNASATPTPAPAPSTDPLSQSDIEAAMAAMSTEQVASVASPEQVPTETEIKTETVPMSGKDSADDVVNYDLLNELMGDTSTPAAKVAEPGAPAKAAAPTPTATAAAPVSATPTPPPATPVTAPIKEKIEAKAPSASPPTPSVPQVSAPPVQVTAAETNTKTARIEPAAAVEAPVSSSSTVADSSIRVDVALLDQLMNLVGELVLARNQILQFTKTQSDSGFVSTSQRLNLITSELQEGVMKTRMQPISNVWGKFPRVVRDIARLCNKEVRLEMEGKETELDKTILEAIKDPLTHIVRNSVDHGIETPDVRVGNGKSTEGCVTLKAFHEGGHVIIEIIDDGAGLKTEKIRTKATQKGLITAEQAARMSDAEINRLVFAPGFSTADQITNISGRGVGMDVVKSNIERIGGNVDISSTPGHGSAVKIKIPLTLAIVPALIVSSGGSRFAIPQVSLLELVSVSGEQSVSEIEEIDGSCFYRLRGNLLPLVYLNTELRLKRAASANTDLDDQSVNIVIVKAEDQQFGLVVDQVHDTEEIVVKPLGKQLKDIPIFAGATIMGDGKVALIVDVTGLGKRARVVGAHDKTVTEEGVSEHATATASTKQALLLVQVGRDYRVAVPLSLVNRLEEFEAQHIERAGGQLVVQYRGGILPLVSLTEFFKTPSAETSEVRHVVVYSHENRNVGLVVDQILDIVEEDVVVQHKSARGGILGSAVIQKKVTDLLDLDVILKTTENAAIAH